MIKVTTRLRDLRKMMGLTRFQMAEKIGVTDLKMISVESDTERYLDILGRCIADIGGELIFSISYPIENADPIQPAEVFIADQLQNIELQRRYGLAEWKNVPTDQRIQVILDMLGIARANKLTEQEKDHIKEIITVLSSNENRTYGSPDTWQIRVKSSAI